MLSKKHKETAEETIQAYIEFTPLTVESINEGCCDEFAEYLNEEYARTGLDVHQTYCTCDFISPNADQNGNCEYIKDWLEDAMASLGIPSDYFLKYRKQVESVDSRGMVPYHVWLFDGEHHYDATCLDGVKNPLELPFFKNLTNKDKVEYYKQKFS